MADDAANAWCRIDDILLLKTGELVEETSVEDIQQSEATASNIGYFSITGIKHQYY